STIKNLTSTSVSSSPMLAGAASIASTSAVLSAFFSASSAAACSLASLAATLSTLAVASPATASVKHSGGNSTHHQLRPSPLPSVTSNASYMPAGYTSCPYIFVGNSTCPISVSNPYW